MGPKVLAGKISYSVGNDQSWVNPSSVRARQGQTVPIEVFNGVNYSRTFQIEKVVPYDGEIADACGSVEVDTDFLILDGFGSGGFNVSITSDQEGEAWIRITPEYRGMLQQAWIVRIKVGS